jgi:hypothetical protein
MRLAKKGVPHRCSKWSIHGGWYEGRQHGLTPSEVQSIRKRMGTKREKVRESQ